jgi:hypothetical protein
MERGEENAQDSYRQLQATVNKAERIVHHENDHCQG